jgi:UDP-N-acetylmuramoylalanine--D-glutamate ligase
LTGLDLSAAGLAGRRALVVGLGLAGRGLVTALTSRGVEVVVIDDQSARVVETAAELEVEVTSTPSGEALGRLVGECELVCPSPAVPETHPVLAAAAEVRVPVVSELDLAQAWTDIPMVAVTGTNGKTTVVALVTSMLAAAGQVAVAAGNNELPLVTAIDDHPADVYVVEASSFRLAPCRTFRPVVGTWLNVSPDHLDWHVDAASYFAAKAKIWAQQGADDVAVAPADDPAILQLARAGRSTVVTFGPRGHWEARAGTLMGESGAVAPITSLRRALPHDITNALAAAATAHHAGAGNDAIAATLESFAGLPHRVTLVGEAGGVMYYDDSKATTPDATLAAVAGFTSVVLIAGGRNKGLDLHELAAAAERLRAVVAIGDAAPEVEAVFTGVVPVRTATSMDEAVAAAHELARPGDTVLLSPGCASFDWYRSYGERGDDFVRAVTELLGHPA